MNDLAIVDENNVAFKPSSCKEAVILFNRIRKQGINDYNYVPEILQHCARGLSQQEHDKFVSWIVNPAGISTVSQR